MERRQLFKKLAGLAIVLPASVVALRAAKNTRGCYTSQECSAPVYTPPPPDTRTPEQVVSDYRDMRVKHVTWDLGTDSDYPGRPKYCTFAEPDIIASVAHRLADKGAEFEWRTITGKLALVCNGNVLLPY